MKRYILSIFLLVNLTNVSAQVTTVYFIGDKITGDKFHATSFAVLGKLAGQESFSFKRYDLYNNLLQTGFYKDKTLSIPHGPFVSYFDVEKFNEQYSTFYRLKEKERFLSQEENYVDGELNGKLTLYYPNGKVLSQNEYVKGKMNGTFTVYDKLGKIKVKGNYVDGIKNGEWFFDDGKYIAVYENGIMKSVYQSPKKTLSTFIPEELILLISPIIKTTNPTRRHMVYLEVAKYNQIRGTNFKAEEGEKFLEQEGDVVDNLEEGLWLFYYPNGQVSISVNYTKGILNGPFINYDIFGNEVSKGNYKDGMKDGRWLYNGNKIAFYENGIKVLEKKEKKINGVVN